MNWKLLFRGLGIIWFISWSLASYAQINEAYSASKPVFCVAVVGLAVAFVIAAACPEKKRS